MHEILGSLKRAQARSSGEYEEYQKRDAERKHNLMNVLAAEYWKASGVPIRHRQTLPQLGGGYTAWTEAFRLAREAVASRGIIALIGDRGTGKTQIGVEVCRIMTLIDKPPRTALYVRAAEMYGAIRDNMRSDHANEAVALRPFTTPYLLIVDEAHERNATSDFEPRVLNLILDKRYGECLPTVLIANVRGQSDDEQGEAFRKLIGETIVDRISETGWVLCCNWKSFRVKGGQ